MRKLLVRRALRRLDDMACEDRARHGANAAGHGGDGLDDRLNFGKAGVAAEVAVRADVDADIQHDLTGAHALRADHTGLTGGDDEDIRLGIRNETLEGFNGVYMQYKKSQLPYYGMWRNLVQGDYVVGLEPGTSSTDGRKKNLAKKALKVLAPMESMQMELTFGILTE